MFSIVVLIMWLLATQANFPLKCLVWKQALKCGTSGNALESCQVRTARIMYIVSEGRTFSGVASRGKFKEYQVSRSLFRSCVNCLQLNFWWKHGHKALCLFSSLQMYCCVKEIFCSSSAFKFSIKTYLKLNKDKD